MSPSEDFKERLLAFRDLESDDARGPAFAAVVRAIEEKARTTAITREMIVAWLDPPDLFSGKSLYVYRFDHDEAGRNCDEHYFLFDSEERLSSSMYNECGINDLSMLSPGSEFGEQGD